MIESSRTPVSASCKVRGIGVAVSVSTCTSARSAFSRSLWATPKVLLLVDDDEAEIAELDLLAEERMGADHDIDAAIGEARFTLASHVLGATSRDACAIFTG